MPKRSSLRKFETRNRRRIQCSRCGNSYSYSGSRSHVCPEISASPDEAFNASLEEEIKIDCADENVNSKTESEDPSSCCEKDVEGADVDHDESHCESGRLLSPEIRRRLRERLRKRFNEEDLDYFEDDEDDLTDSAECSPVDTDDSVNEEWNDPSEGHDLEEDFDQEDEGENVNENSTPSDKCGALIFWLLLFLLSWQSGFSVTDTAVEILLKFLSRFLWLVGTFDGNSCFAELGKRLPNTLYKLRKHLGLLNNDNFIKFVVCPKCKTLYDYKECMQKRCGRQVSARCKFVPWSNHPHRSRRGETVSLVYPKMVYPYNSVIRSLQQLFGRPGFWMKCQEWRKQIFPGNVKTDIYQGNVWKELSSAGFLSHSNSLAVMFNVDWFRPYKHSPGSVGVVYLVLLNLPCHERYKLENIIVVGILPGPSEPKLTANTFFEPLVKELQTLWACKERFAVHGSFFKRAIKVGLICVSSDIPATRKIGGFLGHMASQGCSRCKKDFSSGQGLNFSGFDRENWPPRNSSEHKCSAKRTLDESSPAAQQKLCSQLGARYSVLQELEYFDCIRYFVVDPMHNLYLGTAKHMMKNVWLNEKNDFISDEDFQRIQELVDSMTVPQDIGCIPGKISCSFSGFTADQWKNWTVIYSIFALKGLLPDNHLECWRHFVLACKRLGKRVPTDDDIEIGDSYLMKFCTMFEKLYGQDLVTPNMHLHGHIKECLLDYGPFHAFWCFSFERFNGILGSFHTNNRSIEIQLMRKFLMQSKVKDFKYPEMYQDTFKDFFDNCQGSGSVKDTQEPIEQYLSLQEHREVSVGDLHSCSWTVDNNNCICATSSPKDAALDCEDLNVLKSVYKKLLDLDETTTIEMPFTIAQFKSIRVGSELYGSLQSQRLVF
ncbi:uncharacterized protein [Montipora foliosa]|uniref:uncharacterized protein n=1 Tax=Montipora foliosa TaxID=591990 RepID=UPI0035F1CE7B